MTEISMKKILVPVDGSDSSVLAVRHAIALAEMSGAEVLLMHAVVSLPYLQHKAGGDVLDTYVEEAKRYAEMWFEQARQMAAKSSVRTTSEVILEAESIADVIVNYARSHGVDLIVIGSRGRTGLKRFLLGSVASGVVSHAHCPVLIVR
ncbi:universal stress protein [Nitrososphaera sp.]|uniref:universal stress protein n=1 Tax=Nitrososphaera sp. TaxID=1971748 RepID=UPI001831A8C6|nr:universal stress protein [Nitrososphaera sp.]NWG37737.1 universal stress protein [Nitrososphaera sp.]